VVEKTIQRRQHREQSLFQGSDDFENEQASQYKSLSDKKHAGRQSIFTKLHAMQSLIKNLSLMRQGKVQARCRSQL
jgi:uncharacterized beta-barrel protein YwiB (DUF1934 family)